jgi:hypothetical protein
MWRHLWTKGPAPEEYILLILCERFGASILEVDADIVESFITCMSVEQAVSSARKKIKEG